MEFPVNSRKKRSRLAGTGGKNFSLMRGFRDAESFFFPRLKRFSSFWTKGHGTTVRNRAKCHENGTIVNEFALQTSRFDRFFSINRVNARMIHRSDMDRRQGSRSPVIENHVLSSKDSATAQ